MFLSGYPSLAAFIASDKDKSTAIFKRFDRLAARNLLYLQSDLAELQAKLDDYDEDDRNGSLTIKESARNWEAFKQRTATDNIERMRLVLELRCKIKEYLEYFEILTSICSASY
jgi:uncharacterized protein DUF6594